MRNGKVIWNAKLISDHKINMKENNRSWNKMSKLERMRECVEPGIILPFGMQKKILQHRNDAIAPEKKIQ